ncbi:MAG: triose-phosphate isomerase [Planctomycetota bacterium]|nr:triose-phosphate isomerase [Planctomycetota bacterium]
MRVPIIAGNWKMNGTRSEAIQLASAIATAAPTRPLPGNAVAKGVAAAEIVVCPPSCYLECVSQATQGSQIRLGAQNVHHESQGAYTGEISATMAQDLGASFVILGHSERRTLFAETNEFIHRKVHAVLGRGLCPIVCVGEILEQRESGRTVEVVREQFLGSCADLTREQMLRVVVAYEPVWAIGTGRVATPAQAEEVHSQLRQVIEQKYDRHVADAVRIQYGGSVNAANASELLRQPNVDGALVGGASLQAESFLVIVAAANETAA